MAKHVGSSKAEEMRVEETTQTRKKSSTRKTAGTIITGSGAIMAITGAAIKSTLITVLGGAIVIGGVVLLTVPKQSKK